MTDIHLLGIRHHGPGSCRNILQELERIRPDLILLEGPAEAEALMPFVSYGQMKPPVALLGYQPDVPQNAVFYPFADFSPEWQALRYALRENVTLRFFDLPLAHSLAFEAERKDGNEPVEADDEAIKQPGDPFDLLAEAAGYTDGESWWNMNIEQRRDGSGIFEAVKEAVTALREALPEHTSRRNLVREAWMRRMIRGFDSHLRQVEFHQTTAFDERQEVGYHASGQVYPVSARQNPETVQCKRAPPERQFFHMQLTEKDDGRRGHAAPVDMAERGIGKPSDFALVAHTAVERMV